MRLATYLNFGGNCAEAFRFYEEKLGGKILFSMTHGQMPDTSGVDAAWKDKILHSTLRLAGETILGADIPSPPFEPIRSSYLSLYLDSVEEAERVYALLSDGGKVSMAMAETFFAHRFAMLRDRFGVLWMLIHERPMQ